MARYRITTPDGKRTFEVDGPDDATPEELQAFARQQANVPDTTPVDTSGVVDPEDALISDVTQGASEIGNGIVEGAANVVDHAADWAVSGLDAAGQAITGDKWGTSLLNAGKSIGLAGKNDLAGAVEKPADGLSTLRGIGKFVGESATMAPLGAVGGGALVQGALGGALLSDQKDLTGVALDAATGAIAGTAAQKLLRGVSAVADPVTDEGLKTLINNGVRVTPGQYGRSVGSKSGNWLARKEDAATSTPFIGDKIISDRNRSLEDFARATINRAVQPIGLSLPRNIRPGRAAVKWAGDKLSNAYDALLPKLNVSGDAQFLDDLQTIQVDASMLEPSRVTQFNSILNGLGRYWQDGSALSGDALKAIDSRLSERVRRFASGDNPDTHDLADALQAVRDSVHELAARQNPQFAGELRSINQGWKGLVQVEKASGNSKAAISPAGYSQAVRQSSDTARRRGYSRGDALNQDLSDAASDILPSEIADSGTTTRAAQANLPYLAMGLLQSPAYDLAKRGVPLMTRDTMKSPGLSKLLQYGARAAPIAAPAGIDQFR